MAQHCHNIKLKIEPKKTQHNFNSVCQNVHCHCFSCRLDIWSILCQKFTLFFLLTCLILSRVVWLMVSFTCMCCCIKDAEGGQSGRRQSGGRQEDSEHKGGRLLNASKLQITSSKVRNNTPAGPSSARIITTIDNHFLSRVNSIF